MEQLNKTLEMYLVKKAPALPKNIKEILVKFAPWISVVMVIVGLPAVLALFGLGAMMYSIPYTAYGMYRAGGGFSFAVLFLVGTLALQALSVPGLMKRKMMGWNFLYWGVWLNAIYSLLNYQIMSLVVGTLISLYLLFQVKSYYK
jgi:hypothetical protein